MRVTGPIDEHCSQRALQSARAVRRARSKKPALPATLDQRTRTIIDADAAKTRRTLQRRTCVPGRHAGHRSILGRRRVCCRLLSRSCWARSMPERRDSDAQCADRLWQRRAAAHGAAAGPQELSARAPGPSSAAAQNSSSPRPRPAASNARPAASSAAPASSGDQRHAVAAPRRSSQGRRASTGSQRQHGDARQHARPSRRPAPAPAPAPPGKTRQRPREHAPAPTAPARRAASGSSEQRRDIGQARNGADDRQRRQQHGGEAQIEPRARPRAARPASQAPTAGGEQRAARPQQRIKSHERTCRAARP